jgi:hypothetical protein
MSASMAIAAWSKNASCAGLIRTALAEATVSCHHRNARGVQLVIARRRHSFADADP